MLKTWSLRTCLRVFLRGVQNTHVTKSFIGRGMATGTAAGSSDGSSGSGGVKFDSQMLEYLVCPLSKTPLRYDAKANELVCDELKVAYPIVNGIPNLIPQDARKLDTSSGDRRIAGVEHPP